MRQWSGVLGFGNGLADRDAFDARDRDDVSQLRFGDVGALQSRERKQFRDLGLVQRAVELGDGDFFAGMHLSVEDARDRQPSQIVAVVEVRHQNLQRTRRVALGMRNRLDDRVEQRTQVFRRRP